jgi:hypothetical protein
MATPVADGQVTLDLRDFDRWIAKTHCDIEASAARHVPESLIRLAFDAVAKDDDARLFMVNGKNGEVSVDLGRFQFRSLYLPDQPDHPVVAVRFGGIVFLLSLLRIARGNELGAAMGALQIGLPVDQQHELQPLNAAAAADLSTI